MARRNKDGAGPITQAFLDDAQAARMMRNRMDHLPQNIRNQSGRRGAAEPLFGLLSFVRCRPEVLKTAKVGERMNAELFMIARGDVPDGNLGAQATICSVWSFDESPSSFCAVGGNP